MRTDLMDLYTCEKCGLVFEKITDKTFFSKPYKKYTKCPVCKYKDTIYE